MKFRDMLNQNTEELNEAKVQRAWSGKLKQVDALLSWMYDKDILNKGEKAKKDSLFRKYYRFYNDGDIPRGMKIKPKDQVALMLEEEIEEFIKTILSKYTSKIDRKDFCLDKQLSELKTVLSVIQNDEVHSLTKYWKKDVKDQTVLGMIDTLESEYDSFRSELNDFLDTFDFEKDYGLKSYAAPSKTRSVKSTFEDLKRLKIKVPASIESAWKDIKVQMSDIEELVKNIISSIEKLQKINAK